MIDMDKLKDINDAFGHEAGNSAITLVAQCLQRSIRNTDYAARFGGDEFAVLLPGASPEIAEAVVKRVRHNVFKTTLDLRSRMIRCSVSIGVVNYPKDGARHARAAQHCRSQDVPRQGAAAGSRQRGKRLKFVGKCLNVLDIQKNNGKVSAASRRDVIDICQLAVFRRAHGRSSMALNPREPSAAVAAAAGLSLAVAGIATPTAKPIHDPKLKSSSVLIIDQSDSSVLYSRHSDVRHAHRVHHQADDRPGGPRCQAAPR